MNKVKFVIIGGGLAGGSIAHWLNLRGFDDFVIIEQADSFGGDHTWSFFKSDVSDGNLSIIRQFVANKWPSYDVQFQAYSRSFENPYFTIRSKEFHLQLSESLPSHCVRLSESVVEISENQVKLESGEVIEADIVLDARNGIPEDGYFGYQKFLGHDIEFKEPHGIQRPTIMDTRVEQIDGYRFLYVLPLSATQLLVEDTRYSSNPVVDKEHFSEKVKTYARRFGDIRSIVRTESATLPIPLNVASMTVKSAEGVLPVGVRGGWYHPATSYSTCKAFELADKVSLWAKEDLEEFRKKFLRQQKQWLGECRYLTFLNRMAFEAASDDERWRVFELFYRRDSQRIERFYSGAVTYWDRLCLLTGRPPVSVWKAARCLALGEYDFH